MSTSDNDIKKTGLPGGVSSSSSTSHNLENIFMQHVSLHGPQSRIWGSDSRFRIVIAGRRFGKSELAIAEIYRAAMARPKQLCWYVTPVKDIAKDVAWLRLKEVTLPNLKGRPDESKCRLTLNNGSIIALKSAFNAENLRGRGIDFIVIDEFAMVKPEAWRRVFRPALADRKGQALLITTPKGRNHAFDFYENALANPAEWGAFQFTTEQGGIVTPEEAASVAADLDPTSYRQEFLAEFGSVGAYRVYSSFDRATHVRSVSFDDAHPLVWALDFNVDPMIMLLIQIVGENIHVIEELILRPNANTRAACKLFGDRMEKFYLQPPFRQRPLHLRVYGDASGHQRRTAGTETDWAIVKGTFDEYGGRIEPLFFPNTSNPLVRDRVNSVNACLMNQSGESHIAINPTCTELIRDLEEVSWEVDKTGRPTSDLNKSDRARTHASDAFGYFICGAFPMKGNIGLRNKRLYW